MKTKLKTPFYFDHKIKTYFFLPQIMSETVTLYLQSKYNRGVKTIKTKQKSY